MRTIRAFFRIILIFIILFLGISVLAVLMPFATRETAHAIFMLLKGSLLRAIGVKVHGPKMEGIGPGLIMANHRSYLDVLFIPTSELFTIVGKIEVRSWPVFGFAGRALGVLWVNRESKESRSQTRESIVNAIHSGQKVVIFPEGTSWEGPLLLPLKPGMFHESAKHNFNIYQWSLHFDNAITGYPPGVSFLKHLWSICKETSINAYVDVREVPVASSSASELLEDCSAWWNESLTKLSEKHPARNSGYWPDARIKLLG